MAGAKMFRPSYYFRRPARFISLTLFCGLFFWIAYEQHSRSREIQILSEKLKQVETSKNSLELQIATMGDASMNKISEKLRERRRKDPLILGVGENDHDLDLDIKDLDLKADGMNKMDSEIKEAIDNIKKEEILRFHSNHKNIQDHILHKHNNRQKHFDELRSRKHLHDRKARIGDARGTGDHFLRGGNGGGLDKHLDSGLVSGLHEDGLAESRRESVKAGMVHAWKAYVTYAWGYDELQPLSKSGVNHFGGLGATIIDSLDTLYIMGLHDEFNAAKKWIEDNLQFDIPYSASVFETTIRVLGGLLSAYDLSGDKMFLQKAIGIADRLAPAYQTATGLPMSMIDLRSGNAYSHSWTGGSSILADMGTTSVELFGLSQRSGDGKYAMNAERVTQQLKSIFPDDGLLPIYINVHDGKPSNSLVTFGAMGDSFYEYLIKVWVQGGKTDAVKHYKEMWDKSMKGLQSLIKKSSDGYVYIAEKHNDFLNDKMDHLACFVPGMLTLGALNQDEENFLSLAKDLMATCFEFYNSTASKLSGENYNFDQTLRVGVSWNIMRPETVESLFYLWRKTKDNKYREWGWKIWQAFETQCKMPDSGYTGLRDVNQNPGDKDDMMQSFFLAETLKYLYLLFSPDDVIPLDKWVFNTEAHPLKIIPRE